MERPYKGCDFDCVVHPSQKRYNSLKTKKLRLTNKLILARHTDVASNRQHLTKIAFGLVSMSSTICVLL